MKKLIAMVMALSVFTVGCSFGAGDTSKSEMFEIALITDVGTIDDKSFNQGTWEGVEKYAADFGITNKYYKPTEKSTDAYLNSIDLAVKNGAKIILCPGYLFEDAVFVAQEKYQDVKFVILDGAPKDTDGNVLVADNTSSIFYAEQESGFLAGYAAVLEGYTKLGFMGGIAVPAVVRFGYGFVQGADYAAKELGLSEALDIKYTYVGNFDASPDNQTIASSWYNAGTELIFACGGGVGNSVMAAAETSGKKVIGVDVDQSTESETVITSAVKELGSSAYDTISDFYGDDFKGGEVRNFNIVIDGVGLAMDNSRFEKFTTEQYTAIYEKLKDSSTGIAEKIKSDTDIALADELSTENTKVIIVG